MNVRDACVEYVRSGFVLVPIPAGEKGPREKGWQRRENCVSTEEACSRITGNVGLAHAYSGTAAVDFDDLKHASEFLSAEAVGVDKMLTSPASVWISSGRENRAKLLYRLPEGIPGLPTLKLADDALELRCASKDGMTVQDVLPPSIHPDTHKPYAWKGDYRSVPMLPPDLLTFWQSRLERQGSAVRRTPFGKISEGGRNAQLTRIAGALRNQGLGVNVIHAALDVVNSTECDPPLPSSEVSTIAKSVSRYAATEPVAASWSNLAGLMGKKFAPVQWAIEDLVPEGVSLLVGAPKVGKSWLALQWAMSVSGAMPVWQGREPEKGGDVLYLGLEDNDRRMQRRVRKLQKDHDVSRIDYATTWPRMHEGGVEAIGEWLTAHPGARLVVIDTLGRFRAPESNKGSAYAQDYAVGAALKPLADKHQVAIVMLHHTRKAAADDVLDTVSGTAGLSGSVDALLMLRRERGAADACLYVTGRDVENEKDYAMAFDTTTCLWSSVGTVADAKRSESRVDILQALKELGQAQPNQVADHLGKHKGTTRSMLKKMLLAGEVREASGYYFPLTHS